MYQTQQLKNKETIVQSHVFCNMFFVIVLMLFIPARNDRPSATWYSLWRIGQSYDVKNARSGHVAAKRRQTQTNRFIQDETVCFCSFHFERRGAHVLFQQRIGDDDVQVVVRERSFFISLQLGKVCTGIVQQQAQFNA